MAQAVVVFACYGSSIDSPTCAIAEARDLKMTGAIIEEKASLWSAVLLFSVTYLLVSAAVTGVLIAFDLDSNTGVSIGLLVAATAVAARKFVIDHRRPLNRGEQVRFGPPPP